MSWTQYESVIYYIPEFIHQKSYKLAFFDLDGTLITRKSGRNPKYTEKDPNDFIYLGPVPQVLQELKNDGFLIIIFTNQSKYNDIVFNKLENVRADLERINGWSPFIFAATKKDNYRKPNTDMVLLLYKILGIYTGLPDESTLSAIFMCGDSVGPDDPYPPYRWGSKNKETNTIEYVDSKFAENIGCDFVRPIDLFGINQDTIADTINYDMVIMVGNQGSGKSTLSAKLEERGYIVCENDKLTKAKMISTCKMALLNGKKVVIDKTNPSNEDRQQWIDIANQYNKTVCIVWNIRNGSPFNILRNKSVPDIVYNIYTKNFQDPSSHNIPVITVY
jgi:DNA 3'-phosphatase